MSRSKRKAATDLPEIPDPCRQYTPPRRLYRGDQARAEYLSAHSRLRHAASEQGIAPLSRWEWLVKEVGTKKVGAGLLAYTSWNDTPKSPRDAAMRVLADWARGLRTDMLAVHAGMERVHPGFCMGLRRLKLRRRREAAL